jgi:hypothetical protein
VGSAHLLFSRDVTMKTLFAFSLVAGLAFLVGCGGGEMRTTTSSSMTCTNAHECINSACKCTAQNSQKDKTCCDPSSTTCTTNKCDTFCRVCN